MGKLSKAEIAKLPLHARNVVRAYEAENVWLEARREYKDSTHDFSDATPAQIRRARSKMEKAASRYRFAAKRARMEPRVGGGPKVGSRRWKHARRRKISSHRSK